MSWALSVKKDTLLSKRKSISYRIKDNFINFWFSNIYKNELLLETGKKDYLYEQIMKESSKVVPKEIADQILTKWDEPIARKTPTLYDLMKRPNAVAEDVKSLISFDVDDEALASVIIECRYSGYLEKEESIVREQKRLEDKLLPADIDYSTIKALRIEARQKLDKVRPLNLGQASRISGVSPADIAVLIVYLQKIGK